MPDAPKFQLFGIPNNDVGLAFIDQLRSFTNYARYRVKVRGNGPRASVAKAEGLRPRAHDQDIPLAKAATSCSRRFWRTASLRVYIEDKDPDQHWRTRSNAMENRVDTLVRIRQQLEAENASLTRNVQDMQLLHQSLQHDARLAYSRGWGVAKKKQDEWFARMPRLLRKALTYLYGEI